VIRDQWHDILASMVQFGTSGWRGIIGQDITFRKVRMVTQAIVDTLSWKKAKPELVLIGYDTRMLSEKFAHSAAELIAANGIGVEMAVRDIPSPVLSAAIIERRAAAGLTFTASHNPPEYNGLKYYTRKGILASEKATNAVERRYRKLQESYSDSFIPAPRLIGYRDLKPAYLKLLQNLIDWDAIRASGIQVVVDPLFGTVREYLDHILLENQVPTTVIHNTRDPYFGGFAPDCTSTNLTRLRDVMRRTGAHLGFATDGDGDRYGILDRGARLKSSTLTQALLLDYLARRRKLTGGVGRTPASSCLIDAVAASHGLEVVETPVGFKHFGPLLVDGTLEFAAEESAGLAWARHLPERDGILACLLTAEMVAVEGKSLAELKQDLLARVGTFVFRRTQVPLNDRTRKALSRRLRQKWSDIEGRKVVEIDRSDGLKLTFEGGGWILIRAAGTEPKIRLYAEGRSEEEMRHLMHLARRMLTNWRV
jgi:phosphoglucomutase